MNYTEPFKMGEIVIAQQFETFPEYNGQECTIIGELEPRIKIDNDMNQTEGIWTYRVQFSDGMRLGPRPHQLRRRPEPKVEDSALREVAA